MDRQARAALAQTLVGLRAQRDGCEALIANIEAQLFPDQPALDDDDPWAGALPSDPRWMSPAAAAGMVGHISESSIIRWCNEHGIGVKRLGRWRVWKPELIRYLEGRLG